MEKESLINIHAVLPSSQVNGPGRRMVIFFQGCRRQCTGCFNPDTHSLEKRKIYSAEQIFNRYLTRELEGITVSGGEPFLQPYGLLELLRLSRSFGLTSVVYTGYTCEELRQSNENCECLKYIDVLIDGDYLEEKKEATLLARGSTNQKFHFMSNCYSQADFYMPGKIEVIIGSDGTIKETGFSRIPLLTN